jgi:Fe-S cluster assembly iron-binding protein IscA
MNTATRARPAALALTPGAEARIADLMSRAPEGAIGVKLSTPRRGCSGLAYSVDYVTEEKRRELHRLTLRLATGRAALVQPKANGAG